MFRHVHIAASHSRSRQASWHRATRTSVGAMKGLAAIILWCLAFATATADAQQVQYILATVNNDVISAQDLEERLRLFLATAQVPDTPEIRRRLRPQVLRGLIDEKLKVQEARRLNIKLTSQDIDRALSQVAQRNNISEDGIEAFLAAQNISPGTLLAKIRAELIWSKLVTLRFAPTIDISDDEVDEVIARLNANKGKPEHRISEIFLAVSNPDEDEEVRRNAERLADEARRGAPFEVIAKQFSQAAAAERGGEVGWIQPGQSAAEIEAALRAMPVGGISKPIRAEGGYFIIKLHDRRRILVDEPYDARVSLKQILLPLAANADPNEANRQRQLATTIASTVQGCSEFEAITKELDPAGSGDLGTVRIGDLPPQLRDAVAKLEIGRPSAPIERQSGIHVLMVCERSGSRSGIPGREEVQSDLLRQRLDLMARRYLRDLSRDAMIELRQ